MVLFVAETNRQGFDRRQTFPAGPRNDFGPPGVDESEHVPLSPLPPLRSSPLAPPSSAEPTPDIRVSRPSDTRPARPAGEGPGKSAPEKTTAPASERPIERAPPEAFDTVWPADSRPPREDVVHSSRVQPAAQTRSSGEQGPRPEPPQPRIPEPAAVSVLKSGVVDGMAYTLYTDGSIEAACWHRA